MLNMDQQGSFFGPYTPLQQLDILADYDTKSYVVGSTNSLLLQQKERYSDILINLDESNSITITSPSLRTALTLSAADRRWIDFLTQTVLDTWDPENPSRPKNMGYAGSEDAIRLQFEEYILSLLSSMAYQVYHESVVEAGGVAGSVANIEHYPDPGDTATDFNPEFLAIWRSTHNFELFDRLTRDNRIFDIIEPRHPTAGGLSVEDVQRRLQQNLADLHLDERVREGREQLGRTIAVGRERMAKFWADMEKAREQRIAAAAAARQSSSQPHSRSGSATRSSASGPGDENEPPFSTTGQQAGVSDESLHGTAAVPAGGTNGGGGARTAGAWTTALRDRAAKLHFQKPNVDTAQLQASAKENAAKAGAYLSSWGTWARDRMQQQQQQARATNAGTATVTGTESGQTTTHVSSAAIESGTNESGTHTGTATGS